jgi:hypothetical protein
LRCAILGEKKQDCHVAIAPRNDITKTVFVIASGVKQSQADAGSPRIATGRGDCFIPFRGIRNDKKNIARNETPPTGVGDFYWHKQTCALRAAYPFPNKSLKF